MEQSGANAGPDQVFNWQPVHQQVNQLIQRDIYHQRQMQDVANKAAIELKKAGTAARPEDIPELSNLYNTYRTAGMQLLNPKVNRDPTQRAYWQKVQDESELNYHSLANDSKETGKTLAALPLEYAKSGGNGFKPLDEFGQQLQQAKGLSTRQIRERGLDNPITYMGAKELYPAKDYQQHVYGGYESVVGADPVKDAKGQTTAWQEKHTKQPKNPVPVIVHNTVEAMNGIPSIHKQANDAFMTDLQTSPEVVDATIKNAQEFVKSRPQEEQDHIMPYLAKNPLGYELAKNLLGAKPEVTQGKMTEDPIYKQRVTDERDWKKLLFRENQANARSNNSIAAADRRHAAGQPDLNIPRAEVLEQALENPTVTHNGKTAIEQASNFFNTLNSYTTTKTGGLQLQPLPMFSNGDVKGNDFYNNIIDQTKNRLGEAFENNKDEFKNIMLKLSSSKNTNEQKLQLLAETYNKVNIHNGINARFTAEDLKKSPPVIMKNTVMLPKKDLAGNTIGYEPSKKIGILKPKTPEFRDVFEKQRSAMIEKLKKQTMGAAMPGEVDEFNADENAPIEQTPVVPPSRTQKAINKVKSFFLK